MKIKQKISELLSQLNEGIFEKEQVMALALLSSIAGESIFLLGAPGVAKSLIARRLKFAFLTQKSFEYLMNRFSTPDEIFGPVSISQLKDQDKYVRIVNGYLPDSTVVFLDEIWKAGPSIQNSLLTVLNEKKFRNGDQEIDIPMKALIAASNELPDKDNGLDALWDRFLVRIIVEGIKDTNSFNQMLSTNLKSIKISFSETNQISDKEYSDWSLKIDEIEVPENIFNVIHIIRIYIDQFNKTKKHPNDTIYISDRRWHKIVRLLKTSAFLNDRKSVDLMDCFLIQDCIWNIPDQKSEVSQFTSNAIQKHGYSLSLNLGEIKKEIEEFKVEISEETKFVEDTREKVLEETNGFFEILNPPSVDDRYLSKESKSNLTNEPDYYFLYYPYNGYFQKNNQFEITTGKDNFHVQIDSNEYELKTEIKGRIKTITKKPHKKVEEAWDLRVESLLNVTKELMDQIDFFKQTDLKHLRTNLFVNSDLASIVESHIESTKIDIGKIELDIKNLQFEYKKIKQ